MMNPTDPTAVPASPNGERLLSLSEKYAAVLHEIIAATYGPIENNCARSAV